MATLVMQLDRRLALAGFLVVPATSFANVPLPTVFAFNLPLHLGISIFLGLFIMVSLLEGMALVKLYKQEWIWALKTCFLANLISTIIGALLSFSTGFGFFVLGITLTHLANKRFGWAAWKRILLIVGVFGCLMMVVAPSDNIPASVIQVYVTFLAAFLLSILLESFFIAQRAGSPQRALKWALGANGVSYLLLAVLLLSINFRSGAFAQRGWFLWRTSTIGDLSRSRSETILHFQEFYAWERSGDKMHVSIKRYDDIPYYELLLAKEWAEDGEKKYARELMQLVHANYQVDATYPLYTETMAVMDDSVTQAD